MQLADWLFTLLMLRSDDPHGRSAVNVTAAAPPKPEPPSEPRPPARGGAAVRLERERSAKHRSATR